MADSSPIVLFCRGCQSPRYRSIRNIGKDEKLSPNLFQKCDPEGEEPTDGAPARCYVCQSICTAIADKTFVQNLEKKAAPVRNTEAQIQNAQLAAQAESLPPEEEVPHPAVAARLTQRLAQESSADVEVLFEPGMGENILSVKETLKHFMFITNKRVVRVRKD